MDQHCIFNGCLVDVGPSSCQIVKCKFLTQSEVHLRLSLVARPEHWPLEPLSLCDVGTPFCTHDRRYHIESFYLGQPKITQHIPPNYPKVDIATKVWSVVPDMTGACRPWPATFGHQGTPYVWLYSLEELLFNYSRECCDQHADSKFFMLLHTGWLDPRTKQPPASVKQRPWLETMNFSDIIVSAEHWDFPLFSYNDWLLCSAAARLQQLKGEEDLQLSPQFC